MTAPAAPSPTTCPACGAPASGRFCASCGASLGGTCAACRATLTPGARFCHRCGTPVGALAAPAGGGARAADTSRGGGVAGALPWAVAGIALLALVALVAGQRFNATRASPPPGASAEDAGAVDAPVAAGGGAGAARAPDISGLSQREIADRLFDRIMRLAQQGKRDSVQFFAPMALQVYQSSASLDLDQRYDYGRVAEVSGDVAVARAQADTILRASPSHLLGLALAARAARAAGDGRRAAEYGRRLVAAAPSELAKRLPEYERHQADIDEAIREAKGSG